MDIIKLVEVLKMLSAESFGLGNNPSESEVKALMSKYDMLFLGKNFNTIYSVELAHSLNKVMSINVENDDLNALIPNACNLLHMKYNAMVDAKDIGNPNIKVSCYQIELW